MAARETSTVIMPYSLIDVIFACAFIIVMLNILGQNGSFGDNMALDFVEGHVDVHEPSLVMDQGCSFSVKWGCRCNLIFPEI